LPFRALFVGPKKHLGRASEVFFSGRSQQEILHEQPSMDVLCSRIPGQAGAFDVQALARERGCQIAVVENFSGGRLEAPFQYRMPPYLDLEVDLSPYASSPEKILPRSMKSRMKRIQSAGAEAQTSVEIERYKEFYHTMHTPMVSHRHGENQLLRPLEEILPTGKHWFLLFARMNGRVVAGMEIHLPLTMSGQVRCVRSGFLPEVLEDGALYGEVTTFLYFHAAQEAIRRGYLRLNFGLSPASACHGVLIFKTRWGAKVRLPGEDRRWHVWFSPGQDAHFLARHPLLVEIDGGIVGIGATGEGSCAEKSFQDLVHAGLSEVRYVNAAQGVKTDG
jgi:hypothetical protein